MRSPRALCERLGIELPLLQAPMAGAQDEELAVAVADAGGLGALPCALLGPEDIRGQVETFRRRAAKPLNLNFFCHRVAAPDREREARWQERLGAYYAELGVEPSAVKGRARAPFDEAWCALVEELKPEVVSFHFGLPDARLLARVRATGARVLSSATTVAEAKYLEEHGCDAIVAQGAEAGGHRGMFLCDDVGAQVGSLALIPQVVDAVSVPVIAAGGIGDPRGVAAAFVLGASAVQVGTAYLRCPEARITPMHRAALGRVRDDGTRITNLYTGRPARGIVNRLMRELRREVGLVSADVPDFPRAAAALASLRATAEAAGSADFSSLWAGQAASLAREMGARDLTRHLVEEAKRTLTLPAFP